MKIYLKIIFCTFALLAGQVAHAVPTTPTGDFVDNKDGTVTHKKTGLIWQRCSVGQTWTGSTCSGEAKSFTYAEANAEAMALQSDFAEQSDWRLPNIVELQTIAELENRNPAINTTIFPDTPPSRFWSSSPSAYYYSCCAWFVDFFNGGGSSDDNKSGNYFVRLVRGEHWTFGSLPLTTPTADFVNHGNGTVTHKRTGLMWQRCAVGQTRTDSSCSGSASGYTYHNALKLTSNFAGYSDWRLPTENELQSIVEYGKKHPAINTHIFPNTPSAWFWSSSPSAYYYSCCAWIVSFKYGGGTAYDNRHYNYNYYFVRLVRGGQWSSGSLPEGTVGRVWTDADSINYGDAISTYLGEMAYANHSDGSGEYTSTELALRFAQHVLHLKNPVTADAIQFAAANKNKTGYLELKQGGKRTAIVMRYYPKGSTTPPVNGSIISQTSTNPDGHVAMVKKVVNIADNIVDVYLFEQNRFWTGKYGYWHIAMSRKMRFYRHANGKWTSGNKANNNVAVGWLNPEVK